MIITISIDLEIRLIIGVVIPPLIFPTSARIFLERLEELLFKKKL